MLASEYEAEVPRLSHGLAREKRDANSSHRLGNPASLTAQFL